MKKLLGIMVAMLLLGALPAAASAHASDELKLSFVKAPVGPDGTTKGAALDFLVQFADPDPAVDGVGLKAGGTITLNLDAAFDLSGNQGPPTTGPPAIILQGWPQSPAFPFRYTTEIVGNTITLTMDQDWLVGDVGPGAKAVHLLLLDSSNPDRAGSYPISMSIQPDPASNDTLEGHGRVKIINKVRASVNVISLDSGPPGPPPPFFNPLYQDVALGDSGHPVGMYLWNRGGAAAVGVEIEMSSPERGRLMQDGRKIGWVRIKAPKGASDHMLTSTEPSTEVPAFGTDVPTGQLVTLFTPDSAVAGHYMVTFSMKHGNSQTMHYDVSAG
jgi:hypothetical protein